MTGISKDIVFGVNRVRMQFVDAIGNDKTGTGTGFFLRGASGRVIFITNRHNLDGEMKLGGSYKLNKVELLVRSHTSQHVPLAETKWIEVDMHRTTLLKAPAADVALLTDIQFSVPIGNVFGYKAMNVRVADQDSILRGAQIMDPVSFVGYPGSGGIPWWDQQWNTPIARAATIASDPAIPFTNPEIETPDVALVTGMSFSGSSGSPVFTHAKVGVVGAEPPMLIGIMSGHLIDEEARKHPYRHSGLSYFTRSTSIVPLLAAV